MARPIPVRQVHYHGPVLSGGFCGMECCTVQYSNFVAKRAKKSKHG